MRNDYIMDMIEDFGQLLQRVTNKSSQYEEVSTVNHDEKLGQAGLLGLMLKRMCAAGEINEAENRLFEALEENPQPDYFYVALDFYKELSGYSAQRLAQCDFSEKEIQDGVQAVIRLASENQIRPEEL